MGSIAFPPRCGSSCVRISQLEDKRVALWGWGREGRAAYQAIRSRLPALPLTLFCNKEEAEEAIALADPLLTIRREATAESLSKQQVVVKSPGISPYSEVALAASANGTIFIGGSTLWFDEHAGPNGIAARTLCVTGTKGKSTTTALLAHLLRAGGHRTALVGN